MKTLCRLLVALGLLLTLDWAPGIPPYPLHTVAQVKAQQIPKAWPADQNGVPAPACTTFDPVSGALNYCSSSSPLPVSGGAAGTGTTSGSSTTGFGKQWFPSTITGTVANGQRMVGLFDSNPGVDTSSVVYFRRSTTCANCLQVAVSGDGGVTGTFFSTPGIISNNVQTAFRVPSSTVRYLVSNVGGPTVLLQSPSLSAGWTAITGLANPVTQWDSKPDGSRILAFDNTGLVCVSTDTGVSFGSCVASGAAGGGNLQYAGGTVWLIFEGAGNIRRSTNDGASWSLITSFASNAQGFLCENLGTSTGSRTCLARTADGNIHRSTDQGATWTVPTSVSADGNGSAFCLAGSLTPVTLGGTPPVGFGTISQNSFTSFNDGLNFFPGQTNGSNWDGTGVPSIASMDCRNGKGIGTYVTTGGGVNVFAVYNPLTQPGGVLQSSAGGYTVSALIQSGIILNAAPTVSGANAAATVTLTNTAGSRICIRAIAIKATGAAATFTLTVTDGGTTVLDFGTQTAALNGAADLFTGQPLVCSQTNNNLVVNIGAGGAAAVTTTSVIADRYPN